MVRIDPKGWIPKELDFEKTPEQWAYQLAHAADVLGRVEAARALGKKKEDAGASTALAAAWPREKESRARAEIVDAIASVGEAGRPALLEAAKDAEARVRVRAYAGLAALKKDAAAESLLRAALADRDEAYGVRKAALGGLVRWKVKDRDELIAGALKTPSHEDVMAAAGVEHLLKEDGPTTREDAVLYSGYGRPSQVRFTALSVLSRLAKDDPTLQDVLISLIDDPERRVRFQAIQALSRLGLKRALAAIEARVAKEDDLARLALDAAVTSLKEGGRATPGDPSAEAADLDRKAADLDLQAKELHARAEAAAAESRAHQAAGRGSTVEQRFDQCPSDRFDRQLVPGDERIGLGPGEDPGRGADRADATGADGAGELQAVELGEVVEQAGDVAGDEGIAAPGAVDEGDGIGAEADLEGVGDGDGPLAPAGDDHAAGAEVVECPGLANRVGLAQDQCGLVGVGQEDIGVGKDQAKGVEVVAGPGDRHVEDRPGPPGAGRGEARGQARRVELGQDQEIADREHARRRLEHGIEVGAGESQVGPDCVDEPPILAADVDDQRLARGHVANQP